MVNKVILVGNVGADPEVRYVSEGVAVAQMTLATSESYKNKQGERVTNTEWHKLVVWRGLAKVVEDHVRKGQSLYIEGKITHRSYEKDGETKYITEIVVSKLKMLGSKKDSAAAPQQQTQQANTQPQATGVIPEIDLDDVDDIPF